MRGPSVFSLLLACAALVRADTCSPPPAYAPGAQASDSCYTLNIVNDQVQPDGFPRQAITIDNQSPGRLLSTDKGNDLWVQVKNGLTDDSMKLPTSVHWHGILQPKFAFDDGPAGVTQCPIAPEDQYTYKVETGEQAGTFWYHSHFSSQYVDGLRGPLVVYDRDNEPAALGYDADESADNEDTIIDLTDWYHLNSHEVIKLDVPLQSGDSALFKGKALYRDPGSNNATITGERGVLNVQKNKKYRLRVINMSARSRFTFGIQGHTFTVVEADGVQHKIVDAAGNPKKLTSLGIAAGQRYSIILTADQNEDNYWIAYNDNRSNGVGSYAVLHYNGAPPAPTKPTDPDPSPPFVPDTSSPLNEWELQPAERLTFPTDTLVYQLEFGLITEGPDTDMWYMREKGENGTGTFHAPDVPTLLQILSNTEEGNQTAGIDKGTIIISENATVEVSLQGNIGNPHPFHLHGHVFEVVQSAGGPRNDINPPIRDTVDTNNAAWDATPGPVTIRFPTNNPGPWFLHCHIDFHLEEGLAVVFAEDPELQRENLHPPKEWCDVCANYDTFEGKNTTNTRLCRSLPPPN